MAGRRESVNAIAAGAILLSCGGFAPPWTTGPLLTDRVLVTDVVEPKVGSGVLAIFARVTATTAGRQPREYFILYMGQGQTLPLARARCDISYRFGRLAEWRSDGNLVERFTCNDGRHWPNGSPPIR